MKLLLLTVSMIMVVTINCRGHWKPQNHSKASTKTSRDNGLGPPISAEEIAAAIADSDFMEHHSGEDHIEEHSGKFEGDIILTPEQQAQMEITSRGIGLGPPISAEEIAAAITDSNLTKHHPGEDHSIEISDEFEGFGNNANKWNKTHSQNKKKKKCENIGGECMPKKNKKNCKGEIEPMGRCKGKDVVCCVTLIDNGFGPPISAEEIAAAIADSNLLKPYHGEDHEEENSGEFEGDIILTPEQQAQMENGVRSATTEYLKWENGIIPYIISADFIEAERNIIAKAIAEYHAKTCIKIIGRKNEPDYIEITRPSPPLPPTCSSNVGRLGRGRQYLKLSPNCFSQVGTTIHEFMHAAGFWHEQSRYDRDNYVDINLENVRDENSKRNFNKNEADVTTLLGLNYDYSSVMHYGATYMGRLVNNRYLTTITPRRAGVRIGQRDGFSKLDLLGLNILYNCGGCVGGVMIADQCLLFSTKRLSWNAAKEKCSSEYGKLASLNAPQAFKDFVQSSKYDKTAFWLGGSDTSNEGSWVWQNGQSLGNQFPWKQGQPNDYGDGEDCLRIWSSKFYDTPCARQFKYVCEKVCGGDYTSTSGTIRHPLSGTSYGNNEDCVWTIRTSDPIKITFISFDLENGYDYLKLRDGNSIGSTELGDYTGSTVPSIVHTSSNKVFIVFTSDRVVPRSGFELQWETLAK